MSATRERARARANNQRMAQFIELWIIVYASPPTAVGNGDPRIRRYLRLRNRYPN